MSETIEGHGGQASPGFDNYAAITAAIAAAAANKTDVRFGAGTYEVSSASLAANDGIARPSRVALIGIDRSVSKIQVTGASTFNQLFQASDRFGVVTRNLTLLGHGTAPPIEFPTTNCLLRANLTNAATATMTEIVLIDCDVHSFGGEGWMIFQNLNTVGWTMRRCGSRGCNWFSYPGNQVAPGDINYSGHFLYFYGEKDVIQDVFCDDRVMDANGIKGGVICFGDIRKSTFAIDTLRDPGVAIADTNTGPDGSGASGVTLYAKQVGATLKRPTDIDVRINRLENPWSCGIYLAAAEQIRFVIGEACGQRSTKHGSLPRGVVAINRARDVRGSVKLAQDNARFCMISLDGAAASGFEDCRITLDFPDIQSRSGARDVAIDLAASSWAGGVRISGRRSGPAQFGVLLGATESRGIQDVDLSDFDNLGAQYGVSLAAGAANAKLRRIRIGGRKSATENVILGDAGGSINTEEIYIRGSIEGPASSNLVYLPGYYGLDLDLERIKDSPSVAALELEGARGIVRAAPRTNVGTMFAGGSSQLGKQIPNWTGTVGDIVANLDPNAGEAGGWICVAGSPPSWKGFAAINP